jgi:hypothetical protein
MGIRALVVVAALLAPAPLWAQLREMRQVIHGMD